ncbi:serine/threonine protein kinase [Mesorhizobium sp. B2-2-3]|uniref:serine/threonine-protein kinase n=1 Tax=Mesorhizobium sp. B2-2-3 TaxID=2589963 RepID=UPI00112BF088|nr:serine/threonine-protein kinase [Mesorhizobium sp. B2-2-3]TPM46203.1 serine/threonine protein kinase [Mesorhizobium sp. B2-2-3]
MATIEEKLDVLEKGISDNVEPRSLSRLLDDLELGLAPEPSQVVRYLLVQAAVHNRLGSGETALVSLLEARRLGIDDRLAPFRPAISRLFATVYSWRGRGEMAAFELLRAMAEASGDGGEIARTFAETGRLNKELGRFDASVLQFDAALESDQLTETERARAMLGKMQVLGALSRHAECLALGAEAAQLIAMQNARLRLLHGLEVSRSAAALGQFDRARRVLEESKRFLPEETSSWSWIDWTEAGIDIETRSQTAADEEKLRSIIERFNEDGLPIREASARLLLAEAARRNGNLETAMEEASIALRIATAQGNKSLTERARGAMLSCDRARNSSQTETLGSPILPERYLLCEVLGRGGYGVVRRAYDLETGAERAIKMVDFSSISDVEKRQMMVRDAQAEVEAARRVRHPGLVVIYNAFIEDSVVVIVQDLVRGMNLRPLMGENLSRVTVLDLFTRIAHALAALHAAGIVHRDLKPENIVVDERGNPVIIDFGLAAFENDESVEGRARGTHSYTAPEVAGGRAGAANPKQDIYSFGVMLAEFLPARPVGVFSWLSPDPVARLVRGMTAADPARRPYSMHAIAATLDRELRAASA